MKKYQRTWIATAISFATFAMMSLPAFATPTVGADGAVDGNLKWEQGTASTWYIELQRYGLALIEDGIAQEHDADIRKGILVLDWGFAHQAADGSFAGSGDLFHSTSIFVDAAAQATLLLKTYNPVTYAKDATFYSGKVSTYTTKLKAAAKWLILPSVATAGQAYDQPYTHRRYLLASALGQVGKLTSDSSIITAAANYVSAGLPLQLTSGTLAVTYPTGTVNVSLVGVNPEMSGYDVTYQCAGIRFAALYALNGGSTTLKPALVNMMTAGLGWEASRIDVKGNIDVTGSTRVGVEKNRDGTVKQVNIGEVIDAFDYAYQVTGNPAMRVWSRRVYKGKSIVSTSKISTTGAVDANANYDAGTATTYGIDLQKLGTDYIEAGIDREDASVIAQGIKILDWGFAKQATDGSFPGTTSNFYTTAQFVDGAARAAILLQNYHPVTYSLAASTYSSTIIRYVNGVNLAAKWLMRSDIASAGQKSMLAFTHRYYVLAAALGGAGYVCNDASMTSAALWYVNTALPRQDSAGVNPESGTSSVNYQAKGLQYAEYYLRYVTDATLKSQLVTMIDKGLAWESQYVDANGVVNTSSPSKSIGVAFALGYTATGKLPYKVIAIRMNTWN